jgi:histone H3/H4
MKSERMELSKACAERILRRTAMRVSEAAVREFAILLEEVTADLAAEAAATAKRAGRKTVLVEDVRAAQRKLI